MARSISIGFGLSILATVFAAPTVAEADGALEPVALVAAPETDEVVVACAGGQIVRLDGRRVAHVSRVARSLSDLIARTDNRGFAATDTLANEVLILSARGEVVRRHRVARPSSVLAVEDTLVVGSVTTRSLTFLDEGREHSLALPFAPGEMLWLKGAARLVVADAFGSSLAEVDTDAWKLVAVREIVGHNIRGLAADGDGALLVAHQILDPNARASFDDLHWGNLVRNVVRTVTRDGSSRVDDLGDVGAGAGDPSSLARDGRGRLLVTLAGTDELLVRERETGEERRFSVGDRPIATLVRGDRPIVVANGLGESVSFVDPATNVVETVRLRARPADEIGSEDPVARGRSLFFDARLSHDGWMSCHSCHTEGHTSGMLADTKGDETHGSPKRVLSLLGVGETAPYAWNGSQATLEEQIEKTLRTTMHSSKADRSTVRALAAFLRTLPAPARKAPAKAASDRVERGREIFATAGCTDCHSGSTWTSADTYDVGLVDEAGLRDFNPPSLRGVGSRTRLVHDGRFRSLEAFLAKAKHPGTDRIDDLAALAAYLRTL